MVQGLILALAKYGVSKNKSSCLLPTCTNQRSLNGGLQLESAPGGCSVYHPAQGGRTGELHTQNSFLWKKLEDLRTLAWELMVASLLDLATIPTTLYCLSNMQLLYLSLYWFLLMLRNNSLSLCLLYTKTGKQN